MLITLGKRDLYHHSSMDFIYEDDSPIYQNKTLMAREIKRRKQICDCYICANDSNARFFLTALEEAGYKCPKDVKVIGFDNSTETKSRHPYLTTVELNSDDLASTLYDTLLLKIKNPLKSKMKITLKTTLVQNESTEI